MAGAAPRKKSHTLAPPADWLAVARHGCGHHGTYTQETFLALWGACVRWVGQVATAKTPVNVLIGGNDPAFAALVAPLNSASHVAVHALPETPPRNNVLLIASQGMHAAIYFQEDLRRNLQRYHGGWSFTPAEVQALWQVCQPGATLPTLNTAEAHPAVATMATALIHGLEEQAQALDGALQEVNTLTQQAVNSERLAAIGQLCSVVAHEIRNPLGLIDLYAKLIEGQAEKWVGELQTAHPDLDIPNDLPFSGNIAMVREAVQGLEVILSELTQYARPLTLDTETQLVVPLVQRIVEFYQPKYAEKGVSLVCNVNPALEAILYSDVDAPRFRQGLLNLLKNALEASKAETTVTVTIASRENDRDIYIKVADEGAGIPERALEKLFTPYFSTKGNGTGLGLAHTRKIMQAHGGRVELLKTQADASQPTGTTFALVLPRLHTVPEGASAVDNSILEGSPV